ncbi:FAD-dependent oxidoreductase [Psychrobium sp. nBUS_13]|uniref:FAD-dependent oxidoreductase n=1 Tax=Psychrobium sp. nBUS_13 TaxID=3395319 RepID=UPI003EC0D25C
MNKKSVIVLGGGIAGVTAALVLAKQNYRVTLIEKEQRLGGLLNTAYSFNGYNFDYGTHFLATTNIRSLDKLLFPDSFIQSAFYYPYIKAGNVFNNKLNTQSPSLDMRALKESAYNEVCAQLFNLPEQAKHSTQESSCEVQLNQEFGPIITKNIFSPILKKLVDEPLNELTTDAHKLFSLQRIIVGNEYVTNILKSQSRFDDCLSNHRFSQGISKNTVYYPKAGMKTWIDSLTKQLVSSGVSIITGANIENIDYQTQWHCQLEDGEKVSSDRLISTISPYALSKMTNVSIPQLPSVKMRNIHLFHFVFEDKLNTDLHYFYNYEQNHLAFRVTLYPRVNENSHLTIEVLNNDGKYDEQSIERRAHTLVQELLDLAVIKYNQGILHSHYQYLGPSFPVQTPKFKQACKLLEETITQAFPNLESAGKAQGKSFFMLDVMKETYHQFSTREVLNDSSSQ